MASLFVIVMITSLGLDALVAFFVLAFKATTFAAAGLAVTVFVLEVLAFAVATFLERILLPFEDSFSRFPMAPAPSSFELVHLFVLHSNGDIKTDSASASNAVDR